MRYFSFMKIYSSWVQIAYTSNDSWNCALSFTRTLRNMLVKTPSYIKWYYTVEKHNCYSLRLIMALWFIAVVSGKPGWSQSFYVCKDVTGLFIALSLSIGLGLPVCAPVWCLWTPGEWAQGPMHWRQALFQAPPAATVFFLLLSFVYLFKLCVCACVCLFMFVWGGLSTCVWGETRGEH